MTDRPDVPDRWVPQQPQAEQFEGERRASAAEAERHGREDGSQGNPTSDAILPTQFERTQHGAFLSFHTVLYARLASVLSQIEQSALNQTPALRRMELVKLDAARQINEVGETYGDDVVKSALASVQADARLRDFEAEHRIRPVVWKPTDWLVTIMLLILTLIGESVANSGFFLGASDAGWLGAVFLSAAVSSVNLLLGIGSGVSWRFMQVNRRPLRIVGYVGTVTLGLLALFLHLRLAQLREAAERGTENAVNANALLDVTSWQSFTSITPFALLLVGVAIYLALAVKAYLQMGYPGHRSRKEAAHEARVEFEETGENLRNALLNAADKVRTDTRAGYDRDIEAIRSIRGLLAEGRARWRVADDSLRLEMGLHEQVIHTYRTVLEFSHVAPLPGWFFEPVKFNVPPDSVPSLATLEEIAAAAERVLAANEQVQIEFETWIAAEQTRQLEVASAAIEKALRNAGRIVAQNKRGTE